MIWVSPIQDLQLTYERSGYVSTGRYAEAITYCNALAKRSPNAKVITYGRSPEGRPMVALIISADRQFGPVAKRKKPLIYIQNGIHSGEIEGKDASLILARQMLLESKHKDLVKGADWLIIPVYNVDGHERFSAYNRVNQNGPVEMGWRSTGQNYNLNRDYMKADAPETQAFLRLWHRYKPDFFFDDHTTDGADFQYVAMLAVPNGPVLSAPTAAFQSKLYEQVRQKNDAKGFLTSPYFNLEDRTKPEKGISVDDFAPRYSNGYVSAQGIPSMLVETHVLKDYRSRVEATASTLIETSRYLLARSAYLRSLNAKAAAAPKPGETVTLGSRLTDSKRPFTFLGWKYEPKSYEGAGGEVAAWTNDALTVPTTIQDVYAPGATAVAPAGYLVPSAWTEVINKLRLHGQPVRTLKQPVTDRFDTFRFSQIKFPVRPFEGRFQPSFEIQAVKETRTIPAGSFFVPVSRLAMQLLEPAAPDSLIRWGLFNNIFEQKEYYEDYAMAPKADALLKKSPAFQAEFDRWLVANPGATTAARLRWLFDHSPYADARLNAYPVVRLSAEQAKRIQ